MRSASVRVFAVLACVACLALVVPADAFAAPPALSAITPADGASFIGGFRVTFSAADTDGLAGQNASISIAGRTYRPAVAYAGYWDGDGCDEWWVEDRTQASFSYNVPDPGPGIHAVTISVPDTKGETATRTLTVKRTAAITFGSQTPYPGGRYTSVGDLQVVASGTAIAPASATVVVDGVSVPAACDTIGTGKALVRASRVFSAGTHLVSVSVGDGTSAPPATASWAFTVTAAATPPVVGPSQPAEGSTVQGPFVLKYRVTDTDRIDGAKARVLIGGSSIPASVVYAGYWDGDGCDEWWVEDRRTADVSFAIPDLPPGSHALRFEVADVLGNWTRRTTTILRGAAMQATAHTPADGSRSRSATEVRVALAGASVNPSSVTMKIDGISVTPSFTPTSNGGSVSFLRDFAQGAHTVEVSASDTMGSPKMTTTWSFVVDSTAPQVASVAPAADSTATAADAGITARLTDADSVVASSIRLAVDGTAMPVQVATDAGGTSVRWPGVLAEGTHECVLVAKDPAGNEVVHTWAFVVADPPRFAAVGPTVLSGDQVRITAEVTDVNADLDPAVLLTVDDRAVPASLQLVNARKGTIVADTTRLSNGRHFVVATARDSAGNEATKSWSFDVDAVAPTIQSRTPAPAARLANRAVFVRAIFEDAAPIDLSKTAAWLDGMPVQFSAVHDSTWIGEGCDAYEVDVPERVIVSGSLQVHDGPHTIRVRAVDAFGHERYEEWSFVVAEPPAVGTVQPVNGLHSKDSSISVSAKVTDFDGIAAATVEWRRTDVSPAAWQPVPSVHETSTGQLTARFVFPQGDAEYAFRISGRDVGGLVTAVERTVYSDGRGPVAAEATLLPRPSSVYASHKVNFSGRFDDASTIDPSKTRAWIDSVPVPVSSAYEVVWVGEGCDAYEEEVPTALLFTGCADLHDGTHSLKVRAVDALGFETTKEWSFAVREVPKITDVKPVAASRTIDTSSLVSAKVVDFDGVVTAEVEWREANTGRTPGNWVTAQSTYAAATGLLSAKVEWPRDDTRYEVRFTGTDSGGLTTTATTDVFVASGAEAIAAGTECLSCHKTILQTHPMQDCLACHGTVRGPCDCHGFGVHSAGLLNNADSWDHGGEYVGRGCVDCHTHSGDVEAQRHASGLDEACGGCHEQALTAEHAGRHDATGAMTCASCHVSTEAKVVSAIAEGDTSCDACHEMTSGHAALHRSPELRGEVALFAYEHEGTQGRFEVSCGLCHAVEDVSGIHANRCETCHPSPRNSFGTWDKGCQQGDCHPSIHTAAQAGHAAVGCECHGSEWAVTAESCGQCHALVDRVAPHTEYQGKAQYIGSAAVTLKPSDTPDPGGSGVAATYYSLDGAEPQTGTALTITAPAQGTVTRVLEYWSVDRAGNVEERRSQSIVISADVTAPVTSSDATRSYFGPVTIRLTASDDSGVQPTTHYSLDGAPAIIGTVLSVPQPASGVVSHELEFWSVDAQGNAEQKQRAAFTVARDDDPPVTTSDAKQFYRYNAGETINLTADDGAGSGVRETLGTLDGTLSLKGTRFVLASGWTPGVHTLQFWSVDNAGNREAANSVTLTVDGTAPVTSSDARATYLNTATVRFSATDGSGGSGVGGTYYRIDGAPQRQGTELTVDTLGSHAVEFWSVDRVGNSEAPKRVTFTVTSSDTIPPVTSCDVRESYVGSATIQLTATDEGGSGVKATYYRLNGSAPVQGTTIKTDGRTSQTLEYWSVDLANNVESPHEVATFAVTVPDGFGTIQYAWNAGADSWTKYYLHDSSGKLVDSGMNTTGWWIVHVPAVPGAYRLSAEWYDPDWGYPEWTYGSAVVDQAGEVFTWWY